MYNTYSYILYYINFGINSLVLSTQSFTYTALIYPAVGELGAFAYLDILSSI